MKENKTFVSKIEINKKTNEPTVVEVPLEKVDLPKEETLNDNATTEENTNPSKKSIGTQLDMTTNPGWNIVDEKNITKRQKLFKRISTISFVVLIVAVLAFTFYNDFLKTGQKLPSWAELKDIFFSNWFFLPLTLFALFVCYFLKGLKLSVMCKSLTGKAHFRTCLATGVIGHYYNSVTPLAVGGQPFEIYHLSKRGVNGGVASALPIAAFFLNQFAFVLLGIVSLIFFTNNTLNIPSSFLLAFSDYSSVFKVLAIVGLFCCMFMPFIVVLFSMLPRIGASLVHFVMNIGSKLKIVKRPKETAFRIIKNVVTNSKCIKKIATNPMLFIGSLLISFGEQIAMSSIAFFTLKFFGFSMPGNQGIIMEWLQILSICFILYASISFFPTPGNSGAADLSFFLLFETSLFAGLAFPAMMVWRILSFYSFILIGFIYTTTRKKRDLSPKTE